MPIFETLFKKRRPIISFWRGEGLDLALLSGPNVFVGSVALLGCELA